MRFVLAAVAAIGLLAGVVVVQSKPKTELRLTTVRRVMMRPQRVRLVARLKSTDPRLMCPVVVWDFADGSRSARQSACRLEDVELPIARSYGTWHAYKRCGTFRPTISLYYRRKRVVRASTSLRIFGCLGL
jgi:hypothetical protein